MGDTTAVSEADEQRLIETLHEAYKGSQRVGCTQCRYCVPCPSGVDIPQVVHLSNDLDTPGYDGYARSHYKRSVVRQGNGADQCTECGECEEQCPQELPVIEALREPREALLGK